MRIDVEVLKCLVQSQLVCLKVDCLATPHITLGKGNHIKARNNTKVVTASSQGPIQVMMRMLINISDCPISKDDLAVVSDVPWGGS
jgi:hypothetical protein